jgi:hypothetical protein
MARVSNAAPQWRYARRFGAVIQQRFVHTPNKSVAYLPGALLAKYDYHSEFSANEGGLMAMTPCAETGNPPSTTVSAVNRKNTQNGQKILFTGRPYADAARCLSLF